MDNRNGSTPDDDTTAVDASGLRVEPDRNERPGRRKQRALGKSNTTDTGPEAADSARKDRRRIGRRQRSWERSLVTVEALPDLLGCTPREAKRWTERGLIPAAQGRGQKQKQFDPAAVARLRPKTAAWRKAEREPDSREQQERPRPASSRPTAA